MNTLILDGPICFSPWRDHNSSTTLIPTCSTMVDLWYTLVALCHWSTFLQTFFPFRLENLNPFLCGRMFSNHLQGQCGQLLGLYCPCDLCSSIQWAKCTLLNILREERSSNCWLLCHWNRHQRKEKSWSQMGSECSSCSIYLVSFLFSALIRLPWCPFLLFQSFQTL